MKNIYNNSIIVEYMYGTAKLKSEEEGQVSRAYHDNSNYKFQCLRKTLQASFYF